MRHANSVLYFINIRSVPIVMHVPELRPECFLPQDLLLLKNILLWSRQSLMDEK
jgi:hypothetical protein